MSFYTNVSCLGNNILFRGISNDGKRFRDRIEYHPTLYIPTKEESKFRTLEGNTVGEIQPGTMKECREFIRKYREVDNFNIYGNDKFEFSFIAEHFPEEHIDYDFSQIKIAYLDIETSSENGFPDVRSATEEILAISYKCNKNFIVYGCGDYVPPPNVEYIRCSNEKQLLENFVLNWCSNYPDVITGWNSRFFDIPYLVNRIVNVLGEKMANKLSPWGWYRDCLLYTSPSPRDATLSRMPSSA